MNKRYTADWLMNVANGFNPLYGPIERLPRMTCLSNPAKNTDYVLLDDDEKVRNGPAVGPLQAGKKPVIFRSMVEKMMERHEALRASDVGDFVMTDGCEYDVDIDFDGHARLPCTTRVDGIPVDDFLRSGSGIVYWQNIYKNPDFHMREFMDAGGALRIVHDCIAVYAKTGILPNFWFALQDEQSGNAFLRQVNVGHAVRRWIETGGNNLVLDTSRYITADECPEYFNGPDSVMDYEAVIRLFLYGLQLWKRCCEVGRHFHDTVTIVQAPHFAPLGLSEQDVLDGFGKLAGVEMTEMNGAYEFRPHGFEIGIDNVAVPASGATFYAVPQETPPEPASEPEPVKPEPAKAADPKPPAFKTKRGRGRPKKEDAGPVTPSQN